MRCKRYNDNKGDTTDQNKTNGKNKKSTKVSPNKIIGGVSPRVRMCV